ncbi:hypothetical protein [Nonomuraea salmonea]|uniref:hypothetical protein n=1 Tax=Nonomuraea salmonea TaxID=46181 RepID=UPI002FE81A01
MDEFLKWYFSDHPIVAATLGADGYDHTLGDWTADAWHNREREQVRWLERLSAREASTLDDAIDRDLVLSQLRGAIAEAAWPEWRRDPSVYLGTIFTSMYAPPSSTGSSPSPSW